MHKPSELNFDVGKGLKSRILLSFNVDRMGVPPVFCLMPVIKPLPEHTEMHVARVLVRRPEPSHILGNCCGAANAGKVVGEA